MTTKELKQIWNSVVVVAVAVVILEQFCAGYLQNCDLQFPNLTYTRPRLPFTLIFNYKIAHIIRNKGGRHPRRKTQRNKRKTKFNREIKGYTRGKIVEINWEFNHFLSFSCFLVFVFSIYSWGCVSWPKLCSLFFFCKS